MKSIRTLAYGSLILSAGLLSPNALAWGDLGHEIVGAVAEATIETSTKDFVRGLMGLEPLAVSAVFPDHVRDDERFGHQDKDPDKRAADNHDFADYHFCEIPTGFTYDTRPHPSEKDCFGAVTNSIRLLKDMSGEVSREEKMIALRYLVHVIGDVHQPLHVGNGYDIGANLCRIRTWKKPNVGINLHSFWDTDIVEYLGETYADKTLTPPRGPAIYLSGYMSNLRRLHPDLFTAAAKAKYSAGDLKTWLQESQALREGGVYPDPAGTDPNENYKHRKYCGWFSDQLHSTFGEGSPIPGKMQLADLPLLDEETYGKPNAKLVEMQLMKAGLRLAGVLDDIARVATQAGAPVLNNSVQEAILKAVQDAFRNQIQDAQPH